MVQSRIGSNEPGKGIILGTMEKDDLGIFVNALCETLRQQHYSMQQATLGIAALLQMMESGPSQNLEAEYRAKIQALRRGALGQHLAQSNAEFEEALSLAKASLL